MENTVQASRAKKKLTVEIEDNLHQALKIEAARQGITMQDAVHRAVYDYLQMRKYKIVFDKDVGGDLKCPNPLISSE